MLARDRVLMAMNMEQPDRVPFDIELSEDLFRALCMHFAIEDVSVSRAFTYGIRLSRLLNSDMLVFEAGPPDGWAPRRFSDGSYLDEWGILRRFRMRGTIDWFESPPIKSTKDLDAYEFPDPHAGGRLSDLETALRKYRDQFAILGGIGFALWERAWTLHGFRDSLLDFRRDPVFMQKLLDRITDYDVELAKTVTENEIDAFRIGDDYGGQDGLLLSPGVWRRFIKPRLGRVLSVPRRKGLPVVLHTCGRVWEILEDLSEVGVTVLNPVQPRAMDPEALKRRFGRLFCLYGTLDLQYTLPFGTPQQIVEEVKARVTKVGKGGGLILAPAHTVPPDVPLRNVLCLLEAVRKFAAYG